MIDPNIKYSRLFINAPLKRNAQIVLQKDHAHYLKNVMRKTVGDVIRLFNGVDGEWLAEIAGLGKRSCEVRVTDLLRRQDVGSNRLALYFSPIKKQRMQMLIEKSVELGVTDLYPVLMSHSDNTKINMDRLRAQVIEAAEQCERLDLPKISAPHKLEYLLMSIDTPMYVCLERCDVALDVAQMDYTGDVAFMIGPEGGFSDQERKDITEHQYLKSMSLGTRILRAETAAIACLAYANFAMVNLK